MVNLLETIILLFFLSLVPIGLGLFFYRLHRRNEAFQRKWRQIISSFENKPVRVLQVLVKENPYPSLKLTKIIGQAQMLEKMPEKLEEILASPEGRIALQRFYNRFSRALMNPGKNIALRVAILIPLVDPNDNTLIDLSLACIQAILAAILKPALQVNIYQASLSILEKHPDKPHFRRFALEVGRLYYGKNRMDGKATVYDENAIQNDILVRTGMAPTK